MKRFIIIGLLSFVVLGGVFVRLILNDSNAVASFEEIKSRFKPSDIALLDRNGTVLQELRIDHKTRRLAWTTIDDIPPHFIRALLYAEDRRFYQHHGVDWLALLNAGFRSPFTKSRRGASTVTMQVVAMLDPTLKGGHRKKNVKQKLQQISEAITLEHNWSKKEILEAYINQSFYRGELQGLRAATKGIFQKEPSGLSMEETMLLVSSFQQPTASEKRVTQRACRLGINLKFFEDCHLIEKLGQEVLAKDYSISQDVALAPHVARKLLKDKSDPVKSTLDASLQGFVIESLHKHLDTLEESNVKDGAVLVLGNESGEALAYVGNTGVASSYYVDGVQAERQAGSTLKPFLYALAFDERLLTPASILNDSPIEIPVAGGSYRPKNYDEVFHGQVSVRTALASSINVPAVRTLQLIGVDRFVEELRQLGFTTLRENEFYGPSLALGSADITLWELTNAYRTLARMGMKGEPKLTFFQPNSSDIRVFSDEATFLVSDILSDRANRSLTFGLSSPLAGKSWFAVKTGTSKDMRDNWCVGFSDRYTVGVWVGNFSGEPMWDVSGVSGAAPIFSDIIHWLHKDSPSQPPKPPQGVIKGPRDSWFLVGTEPKKEMKLAPSSIPRIVYPVSDTIFAWDPDIPTDIQKITFEAQSYNSRWLWKLNEKELGRANGPKMWEPNSNGKFELSLIDEKKQLLDKVSFQVRGVNQ